VNLLPQSLSHGVLSFVVQFRNLNPIINRQTNWDFLQSMVPAHMARRPFEEMVTKLKGTKRGKALLTLPHTHGKTRTRSFGLAF
jgi:hypothetical protein